MIQISIIILVKNGGAYLEEVLGAVFSQRIDDEFEVVAVDSGSTDRSLEVLAGFPVRIHKIPPPVFNHGETRNLGASLSRGGYLVYLTQDALPGNEEWLRRLVAPLREDPLVAGAYSSHRPRKDCPLMERRQILQTELTSGKEKRINVAIGNPEYERNRTHLSGFRIPVPVSGERSGRSFLSGDSILQRTRTGRRGFSMRDIRPSMSRTPSSSIPIITGQSRIFGVTSSMRRP